MLTASHESRRSAKFKEENGIIIPDQSLVVSKKTKIVATATNSNKLQNTTMNAPAGLTPGYVTPIWSLPH